jgi:hypothetical protein
MMAWHRRDLGATTSDGSQSQDVAPEKAIGAFAKGRYDGVAAPGSVTSASRTLLPVTVSTCGPSGEPHQLQAASRELLMFGPTRKPA